MREPRLMDAEVTFRMTMTQKSVIKNQKGKDKEKTGEGKCRRPGDKKGRVQGRNNQKASRSTPMYTYNKSVV